MSLRKTQEEEEDQDTGEEGEKQEKESKGAKGKGRKITRYVPISLFITIFLSFFSLGKAQSYQGMYFS